MASVSVDDVRDVINVSSDEVSDAKVLKMVKRAEVTLELETDKEIDYNSCTDAEKEFITVLVAIYAICYLRLLSVENAHRIRHSHLKSVLSHTRKNCQGRRTNITQQCPLNHP